MLVTSPFGPRVHPVTGDRRVHQGVDIAAPTGTPVVSSTAGRVVRIDQDGVGRGVVNGNAVFVEARPGLVWAYLHLLEAATHVGAEVRPGQRIGRVGSTGRSTGPHLHLQVIADGRPVDPLAFFPSSSWRAA